ncbi:hypothetical protein PDESU_03098 [Pontiella desulfatans]|uniref:Uncharacterized protein n=1 Tax=Pontiella desulfatans TaxID=2750659 RepID=A0A6C2U3S7_PONDE|nr:RHS repeat domain-containing protein [Pontiella desulfatans]VGO14535.1 hypothetical protein PDESU_03098 [Pontiella desulfatans]
MRRGQPAHCVILVDAYDARNRLGLVTYPGSRTRDYGYDDAGNLLSVDESGGDKADVGYTYDALIE